MRSDPAIPLAYQAPNDPVQGGLSPQQIAELGEARQRGTKIRRAISVAKFDAWTIAIFAGLTFTGTFFGSITAAILGIGMGAVAFVEFKGIDRLRRLDASVAKTLAINQCCLGGLLLLYAIYSVATAGAGMDELKGQLGSSPEVAGFMTSFDSLSRLITYLIYGSLALVAIFGQGGTALYYLSRKRYIEEYATRTPQWIIQAQRAGLPM